jgi:hypothetical protein
MLAEISSDVAIYARSTRKKKVAACTLMHDYRYILMIDMHDSTCVSEVRGPRVPVFQIMHGHTTLFRKITPDAHMSLMQFACRILPDFHHLQIETSTCN